MNTPRTDQEARKELDGKINTIKGMLLDINTKQSLFTVNWFHDKILMNKHHEIEPILKKNIKIESDSNKRKLISEQLTQISQKNCPFKVLTGDVFHIKFGVGVGHELKEHHYGIVLARKGLMFLIAPLTSSPQDYGQYNYSIKGLNLSQKTDTSYVSFCHIRYIHKRRIENIISGNNKIVDVRVSDTVANEILNNYFEIIKEGQEFFK